MATSKKGDLICDPFVGSGTTAEVAQKYGRNFIGFDLNPSSIKMTNERTLNGHESKRIRISKTKAEAKLKLLKLI